MAKTVAQVGRKGTPENQGGEEAQQDSVEVATEDSAPPEEEEGTEDTTAAFIFGGVVEGVAVGASAADPPVNNQPEVDDDDFVGVHPSWSEAVKESYCKNRDRLHAVDPKLIKGLVDFHKLCKLSELDFEVELNRRFQQQKEWDDYNAAFTIAQEEFRAPELSRRETRSVARAKEQVATGKTADRVSMPKPVSSPGKAKTTGGTFGSPGKPKGRGGTVASPGKGKAVGGSPGKAKGRGGKSGSPGKAKGKGRAHHLPSSASSSDDEDEEDSSYSSASSVASYSKDKKRKASSSTGRSTKKARYPLLSSSDSLSVISTSEKAIGREMRCDLKKMEKSIVKKVAKKLEEENSKVVKKLEKMIAKIAPVRDKYKHMIINMELITDGFLLDAWDHLLEIGSKKNSFGEFVVQHRFHETFSGNYFKFLHFQQEHKHGMVPNDAEHKSLCNWLKNQRNLMRDYETKPQSADNNYVRYPEYYHLMIDSGVTGFKY
jgi:hypothetical protein